MKCRVSASHLKVSSTMMNDNESITIGKMTCTINDVLDSTLFDPLAVDDNVAGTLINYLCNHNNKRVSVKTDILEALARRATPEQLDRLASRFEPCFEQGTLYGSGGRTLWFERFNPADALHIEKIGHLDIRDIKGRLPSGLDWSKMTSLQFKRCAHLDDDLVNYRFDSLRELEICDGTVSLEPFLARAPNLESVELSTFPGCEWFAKLIDTKPELFENLKVLRCSEQILHVPSKLPHIETICAKNIKVMKKNTDVQWPTLKNLSLYEWPATVDLARQTPNLETLSIYRGEAGCPIGFTAPASLLNVTIPKSSLFCNRLSDALHDNCNVKVMN